jgi:hypothetical protein
VVEAQLKPLFAGQAAIRYPNWNPSDETTTAWKELASAGPKFEVKKEHAEALERVVQSLVSPIDFSQSFQVETFVEHFLYAPSLKRPHQKMPFGDLPDPVQLRDMDEYAHWIKNERQLLDLLGDLRRQCIVVDGTAPAVGGDDLTKAVLAKQGDFVALIDPEGRFKRLLDRTALLERVAIAGQ